MQIRTAAEDDIDAIRALARESTAASYGHALSESVIHEAVGSWYAPADMAEEMSDDDAVYIVADDDGEIVGYVQSYYVERRDPVGEIDWLHVAPDARGRGVGRDLLTRCERELRGRGVERLEGRVLTANETGAEFYEDEGFTVAGERDVDIGGESFTERFYSKFVDDTGEQLLTEARTDADGRRIYVALDEAERGGKAPFYVTYDDRERTDRRGFLCGACDSVVDTMDAMGRVACSCGNRRKATRWDAAYL
ncbi:GNAT family N-acetyltransferase [Halobaculum sp. MBLA0143]|uniref:GNAT family N-acetyltransferase n=1 Tax=Halobaculum sp. MBLA0143 TaxID=3079933 RepID=UPI003525F396